MGFRKQVGAAAGIGSETSKIKENQKLAYSKWKQQPPAT
jgi:hypothetical protein